MDEYTLFYGFSENPFNLTPDSSFFFLSESHKEALAFIIYGIKARKGFILIVGEEGIGKTSLIQYLPGSLGEKVKAVIIDQADTNIEHVLMEALLKFRLPPQKREKGFLVRQLNEYLVQELAHGENLVIVIDEAHKLSKEIMEELRLLSNLETRSSKLVQIVLVGQPEIEARLNSKDLRRLKQRIVIKRKISRLNEEESREYIEHRLRLVGSSSSGIFTPEAVSLICRYAKGVPGLINMVCDNTLRMGYSLSQKEIDASIVKRAQKQRFSNDNDIGKYEQSLFF